MPRRIISKVSVNSALVLALFAGTAWGAADLWTPPPRPATCTIVMVKQDVIDLSRSMARLLEKLKVQLLPDIASPEPCTLLVVAGFGTTFDVIDAGFANDPAVRSRLSTVVSGLHATQPRTNLDEAAKGIEWVQARLEHAYGEHFVHHVRVYTDDIPAPSPGKQAFSVAEYFARSMSDLLVVEAQLEAGGAHLATPRGSLGTVPLESVVSRMRAALEPKPPENSPPPQLPPPSRPSGTWKLIAMLAGAVLLVGVVAVVAFRRSSKDIALPEQPAHAIATELRVQEFEHGDSGPTPELRREVRLPIRVNMPVLFGRDALHCAFVTSDQKDMPAGELFRVTSLPGPVLEVRGPEGLVIGGNPVAGDTQRLNGQDPVSIGFGKLEWRITPVRVSRTGTGSRLFAPAE